MLFPRQAMQTVIDLHPFLRTVDFDNDAGLFAFANSPPNTSFEGRKQIRRAPERPGVMIELQRGLEVRIRDITHLHGSPTALTPHFERERPEILELGSTWSEDRARIREWQRNASAPGKPAIDFGEREERRD